MYRHGFMQVVTFICRRVVLAAREPVVTSFSMIMLALPLVACVSSIGQVPEASSGLPSPTATPTPVREIDPTASSTPPPPSLPEVLPTPSSLIPFDERVLATLAIPMPDEVIFALDYVWVKTDDGHLFQIDPASNTVVGEVRVDTTSDPYHYCQGLGTDGESIWACSAAGDADHQTIDVVRIDPQSLDVIATVAVGKVFDQHNMPFLLNQIWVLADGGAKLIGIDVTSNQPTSVIDLGARCFQVTALDNVLLATCALDNLVLRIDPGTGEITTRVTLPSPCHIAASGNGVWIAQDNAVARLDPSSLELLVSFTGLGQVGSTGDIFASEEAVWVRQESGFLYRIDPARNELVEQVTLDEALSGGSIVATAASVWTTAYDDDLLIRLGRE